MNVLDQKGETALEVALKSRQPSLARTLVEHQANLSSKDTKGLTLLQSAILKGDSYSAEFIVEQLENNGNSQKLSESVKIHEGTGNIDELEDIQGCTALHLITKHKSTDMLAVASRLLQTGINLNVQDKRGW